MAFHQSELKKEVILDPRIETGEQHRRWFSMIGGREVAFYVYPTTSYSASNIAWDIRIPNSTSCVIDRQSCIMTIPVTITLGGPGSGSGNIYNPSYECLRANPIEKITNTISINMNGTAETFQLSELSQVSTLMNGNKKQDQTIPMQLDYAQSYNDLIGTNMSPFAVRLDNVSECTRGSYPITVVSNTTTSATLQTTLVWNLFDWTPFNRCADNVGINIYPFQINMTFLSGVGMSRLWSRAPSHPQGLTSLSVTINSQPTISIMTLGLRNQLPATMSYPYHKTDFYPTRLGQNIAQSTTVPVTLTSQLIELQTTPQLIYVYVKPATSTVLSTLGTALTFTDTFAAIQNHRYIFGLQTNLLANQTQADIFRMSKKNGLSNKVGYPDWIGKAGPNDPLLMGSMIVIDPVKDFAGEHIAGKIEKIQLQAQVSFLPLCPTTTDYELDIVVVYDGMMINSNGMTNITTAIVTDQSELTMSSLSYNQLKSIVGGVNPRSFLNSAWGTIQKYAPKIIDYLKQSKALSTVADAIPYTKPIAPVLRHLGFGEGEGGFIAGEGDSMMAGKKMTRAALRNKFK